MLYLIEAADIHQAILSQDNLNGFDDYRLAYCLVLQGSTPLLGWNKMAAFSQSNSESDLEFWNSYTKV